MIFEEAEDGDDEDSDFAEFLLKPLASAAAGGVHNGTQLMVVDFSQVCACMLHQCLRCVSVSFSVNLLLPQALSVNLIIVQRDASTFDEKKSTVKFEIVDGTLPVVSAATSGEADVAAAPGVKRTRADAEAADTIDDDGCVLLDSDDGQASEAAAKRSHVATN